MNILIVVNLLELTTRKPQIKMGPGPEQKTAFHREIARKLCTFSEEVERENYIEAVAQKYHISFENLRRLVGTYAAPPCPPQPVP